MPDRIICYGDVIDDIVVLPQGPIRIDTDTRSIIRSRPGGSAANTAAWLAEVGASVDFFGVVGSGDAKRHVAALPGVNAFLREHPALQTGRIVIVVQNERRDMLTDRGANVALSPEAISDEHLKRARLLHLTGHVLLNETGNAGVRTLIDRCRAANVLVSASPGSVGFIADFGPERVRRAFAGADLLFTGYDDGRLLCGEDAPEAIAKQLSSQFDIAVVTRGGQGYVVGERKSVFSMPVDVQPVVDPTGAGDAFCAGFLASWLAEWDVRIAAETGAELAAEAVGLLGGRPAAGAPTVGA
ncbi:MAG TPA: carbohydrate kinase family protein [Thermomicrobiales bacterium]|nr:carbohydrate kinase family protein [Thermomicrobiales bacterium]